MVLGQFVAGLAADQVENFLRSGWFLARDTGEVFLGWGRNQWSAGPLPDDKLSLYAPDFYLTTPKPWFHCEFVALSTTAEVRATVAEWLTRYACGTADRLGQLSERLWREPDRDSFVQVFRHLQDEFAGGVVQKAVPVVFATATENPRQDPFFLASAICKALEQTAPLRPYGLWTENEGIIGVTPELLFRSDGQKCLQTMALAGTRRGYLDEQAERAFLNDPKERHEHQLVIDDLCTVLAKKGEVIAGETGILRLPTLSHLYTPIEARLFSPLSFLATVQALHPTPALGVAPRNLGLDWMRRWDQHDLRLRFGAPFGISGYIGGSIHERTDDGAVIQECLVAIRNIQWQDAGPKSSVGDNSDDSLDDSLDDCANERTRTFLLGSGCGIVPQSELEKEWGEFDAKRESVRRLLGV